MNANELADEYQEWKDDFLSLREWGANAEAMLRQQQAEIEALKQSKSDANNKVNNEPVAWMELYFGEPNNLAWDNTELKDSGDVYKTIPLYTHPAKTLTDEEIADFEWAIKNVLNFSQSEKVVGLDNVIRAILRKAQEKCGKTDFF